MIDFPDPVFYNVYSTGATNRNTTHEVYSQMSADPRWGAWVSECKKS